MTQEKRAALLQQAHLAMRNGSAEPALEICRQLVADDPKGVPALSLLAAIHGQAGRFDDVISTCRQIIDLEPSSIQARSNLAFALRLTGANDEAIRVSQELIRLAPTDPSGYLNLGLILLAQGDPERAIGQLAQAVSIQPRLPMAHSALGQALHRVGKIADAEKAYEYALHLSPSDFRILHSLAKVQTELDKPVQAAATLQRLKNQNPKDAASKLLLAKILNELGYAEEAEDLLGKIVQEFPANTEAQMLLGLRYQETGRFEESRAILRRSLDADSNQGIAYWGLVQGHRMEPQDAGLIAEIEGALQNPRLTSDDRKYMHYALGKSFDDLRQHEQAMSHFDEANQIAEEANPGASKFNPEVYRRSFDEKIRLFTREFFERRRSTGASSIKAIFIVGMMRSGTTLVDQILSSHSLIGGAGELDFWTENGHVPIDHILKDLKPESAREVALAYLALLTRLAPGCEHVTDKKPQNFMQLGLIHTLLPNAKIIHCRRNPADTCLSIYMSPFRESPDYAHRFEHLAEFYREYERLMGHWRDVIPDDALTEVWYEDLVKNKDAETRRLVAFCGVDWEDNCLRPEKNQRPIQTLSLWQARQPIYSSSLNRWKNYEPWLGPLQGLLSEAR